MTKQKSNQTIQKIKADLQEGRYSLKRVPAGERNPFKAKRIKKLWKKIKMAKEESIEDKMLLFFELGKELEDERTQGGNKNYKVTARRLYKSFRKSYPWILINKDWKLRYFRRISTKDAEGIAQSWISTELNPVEGENMWQSQSPLIETQQDDQPELQITLQEVIDMIDNTTPEEMMAADGSPKETMAADGSPKETMAADGSPEETMAADGSPKETIAAHGSPEKMMAADGSPEEPMAA